VLTPGFLVGFMLVIFLVFGGVCVAHLFSFRWGLCCSSFLFSGLCFLVGFMLLIFLVFGGVCVAHLFSFLGCVFWWGSCWSTF
jgi:hypothetical protein